MLNGNKIIEVTEQNSQDMWMEWNTKGNRKNIDNLIHIQTWEPVCMKLDIQAQECLVKSLC